MFELLVPEFGGGQGLDLGFQFLYAAHDGSLFLLGGESVRGEDVLWFELGITGHDLLLRCSANEPLRDFLDGDPVAANAGFAEPYCGVGSSIPSSTNGLMLPDLAEFVGETSPGCFD